MELRPYQQKAVDEIRQAFRDGHKRVLLHLATGGGKTCVFTYILESLAKKGNKGIMVVRGRELVDQAAARIENANIVMAGRKSDHSNISICSIDTLLARNEFPKVDLIVIDEVHLACSDGYKRFLDQYKNTYVLGVTATPYTEAGLRHVADKVICPISIKELISQGYLCPPRYFAPSAPDLSKVKIQAGDYNEKQLGAVMEKPHLVGQAVGNWLQNGENRQTILFAPTVETSKLIASEFLSRNVAAAHIDASTPDDERKAILESYRKKETRILCNVGILTTGVDLPETSCIIMYRPTKSLNLYIQQVGRATRTFQGKKDFLVFDHANNVKEHGFITDDFEVVLDKVEKKSRTKSEVPVKTCPSCYAVVPTSQNVCFCEHVFETTRQAPEIREGSLQEIKKSVPVWVRTGLIYKKTAEKRGHKRGSVFFRMEKRFGKELARKFMKEYMKTNTPDLSTKSSLPYQNQEDALLGKTIPEPQNLIAERFYILDSKDLLTLSES